MERKLILDIKIEFNGEILRLNGDHCEVVMIPFTGSVKGEIFNGVVEPCGVDTQVVNAAKIRHMSARYMLNGKDSEGNDCFIYVENNGYFDEGEGPMTMPFKTVPTFITNSPVLAPYLHTRKFMGEGHGMEDGLHILMYEV